MRKLDHGPAAPKIARPSIHPNPSSRFRRTSIAPPTDDSQITQHRIPTLKSDRLLASKFDKDELTHGLVQYVTSKNLTIMQKNREIGPKNLPFLKGSRYKDEKEYRVVNLSRREDENDHSIAIELEWIGRITLSPWLHRTLVPSVKSALRSIDGCQDLNIGPSTLRNSSNWKVVGEKIGK